MVPSPAGVTFARARNFGVTERMSCGLSVVVTAPPTLIERVDPGTAAHDAAERFVHDHYVTLGFTDGSESGMLDEFAPWRDVTVFYTASIDGRLVGTMRSIDAEFSSLPLAKVVVGIDDDTDHLRGVWREVGGYVVADEHRGDGLAFELMRASFSDGIRAGVTGFCFATHPEVIAATQAVFNFPARLIGDPIPYMGDPAQVVTLAVADLHAGFVEAQPEHWAWLTGWTNPAG